MLEQTMQRLSTGCAQVRPSERNLFFKKYIFLLAIFLFSFASFKSTAFSQDSELNSAEIEGILEEPSPSVENSVESGDKENLVEIEPKGPLVTTKKCNCKKDISLPYRERRNDFGLLMSIGTGQYTPDNYIPDFVVNNDFESFYGDAEQVYFDLDVALKWNVAFGSLALNAGVGSYQNEGRLGAKFSAIPLRLGLTLGLDALFSEPYVVPYFAGGAAMVYFNESLASQTIRGNTGVGFYAETGLLFQLDWLDPDTDRMALQEIGLENTFLYVAGRMMSFPSKDADFATPLQLAMGAKLEF